MALDRPSRAAAASKKVVADNSHSDADMEDNEDGYDEPVKSKAAVKGKGKAAAKGGVTKKGSTKSNPRTPPKSKKPLAGSKSLGSSPLTPAPKTPTKSLKKASTSIPKPTTPKSTIDDISSMFVSTPSKLNPLDRQLLSGKTEVKDIVDDDQSRGIGRHGLTASASAGRVRNGRKRENNAIDLPGSDVEEDATFQGTPSKRAKKTVATGKGKKKDSSGDQDQEGSPTDRSMSLTPPPPSAKKPNPLTKSTTSTFLFEDDPWENELPVQASASTSTQASSTIPPPSSYPTQRSQPSQQTQQSQKTRIDDDSDGELPDINDLLEVAASSQQAKETIVVVSDNEEEDEELGEFVPTMPEPGLLVGEHVYVKHSNAGTYWPATILEVLLAKNREERKRYGDRYRVNIIAWTITSDARKSKNQEGVIKKRVDVIPAVGDDAIATCKLGLLKAVKEKAKDVQPPSDANTRSSTPPPPETFSSELSYPQQLQFIREHLHSIIKEEYLPAKQQIDNFFSAKRKQNGLDNNGYGGIASDHIQEIIVPELRRWALRGERWSSNEGAVTRPEEVARPVGSARYEALSPDRKEAYITDVLLSEAIRELIVLTNDLRSRSDDELRHEFEEVGVPSIAVEEIMKEGEKGKESKAEIIYELAGEILDDLVRQKSSSDVIEFLRNARHDTRNRLGLPSENAESNVEEPVFTERGTLARKAKPTQKLRDL